MRKIQARGFSDGDAGLVLDRLERDGALDERRLAEQYVSERAHKGFGPLRIRAELREKGLADDLIGRYLHPFDEAWSEYLARAHERRFHAGQPIDRSDYAKQARFLEQRGFPVDAIRRFLKIQ
ncbi:RecX family transcriptional regulator [Thiocystis violacea]|nr:regulatory protein RecX [Thiocystis violacea]MBK1720764.1 RecX family transcriptional regulator [Thiocystis violacea]